MMFVPKFFLLAGLVAGLTPGVISLQSSFSSSQLEILESHRNLPSTSEKDVFFYFFSRKNIKKPITLYNPDVTNITESAFNSSRPTKIITHGFGSHMAEGTAGFSLKDAVLKVEDANVFLVDWSALDNLFRQTMPDTVVQEVGEEIAQLINSAIAAGANISSFHIMGHSLGAHVAGYAGSKVLGPAKAGRITGLDPAGGDFNTVDISNSLDPSDAGFVVAIHTGWGGWGINRTVGDVDFFPDGGHQAHIGCSKDKMCICSHCFVYEVILTAITKPNTMVGTNCTSWTEYKSGSCADGATAVVGLNTDTEARGSYFFTSNVKPTIMQRLIGYNIYVFAIAALFEFIFGEHDLMAMIHC